MFLYIQTLDLVIIISFVDYFFGYSLFLQPSRSYKGNLQVHNQNPQTFLETPHGATVHSKDALEAAQHQTMRPMPHESLIRKDDHMEHGG